MRQRLLIDTLPVLLAGIRIELRRVRRLYTVRVCEHTLHAPLNASFGGSFSNRHLGLGRRHRLASWTVGLG